VIAAQSITLLAMAPKQWRQNSNRPMETRLKVHIGFGLLINGVLLLNAMGWPFPPSGGIVMVAVSWNLFAFFIQFAESIRFFFEEEEEE